MRFLTHTCFLRSLATAIVVIVLGAGIAVGIDRLPAEIPSLNVSADDAIREAVRAVDQIEKESPRVRALTRAFHDIRVLEPPAYQPLVDRLERALQLLEDKDQMLAAGEVLYHLNPDVVLHMCNTIRDERTRDQCLRYYVLASIDRPLQDLGPLIESVKNPARRLECIKSLARNRTANLKELHAALREARDQAGADDATISPHTLAVNLSRFPEAHFGEILDLIRAEFTADEQVQILSRLSGQWGYWKKSPAAATFWFDTALQVLPMCKDREAAARMLLHSGAKYRPQQALELFDREIEPRLDRTPTGALSYLAPAGIDKVLTRCDRLAGRLHMPSENIAAQVLGDVASSKDPAPAVTWLQAAPASPLRDVAVARIAAGLAHRASQGWDELPTIQKHAEFLSTAALEIKDSKQRGIACEAVFNLSRRSRSGPVQLPQAIRIEFARLWPAIQSQLEPERRKWRVMQIVALLPEDLQRDAIRESFRESDPRTAAAMIRDSSLADKEKLELYQQCLDQLRVIPDGFKRSAALTAISRALQDVDPELSLQVLWEGLKVAQELKLGPQVHDLSDSLGSAFPCVTADECLRYAIDIRPAQPAKSIHALWSFARTLEGQAEREAVLESALELLLRQKETAKAAGVANLIGDPERRIKAWTAIATVASGKELRNDW